MPDLIPAAKRNPIGERVGALLTEKGPHTERIAAKVGPHTLILTYIPFAIGGKLVLSRLEIDGDEVSHRVLYELNDSEES